MAHLPLGSIARLRGGKLLPRSHVGPPQKNMLLDMILAQKRQESFTDSVMRAKIKSFPEHPIKGRPRKTIKMPGLAEEMAGVRPQSIGQLRTSASGTGLGVEDFKPWNLTERPNFPLGKSMMARELKTGSAAAKGFKKVKQALTATITPPELIEVGILEKGQIESVFNQKDLAHVGNLRNQSTARAYIFDKLWKARKTTPMGYAFASMFHGPSTVETVAGAAGENIQQVNWDDMPVREVRRRFISGRAIASPLMFPMREVPEARISATEKQLHKRTIQEVEENLSDAQAKKVSTARVAITQKLGRYKTLQGSLKRRGISSLQLLTREVSLDSVPKAIRGDAAEMLKLSKEIGVLNGKIGDARGAIPGVMRTEVMGGVDDIKGVLKEPFKMMPASKLGAVERSLTDEQWARLTRGEGVSGAEVRGGLRDPVGFGEFGKGISSRSRMATILKSVKKVGKAGGGLLSGVVMVDMLMEQLRGKS